MIYNNKWTQDRIIKSIEEAQSTIDKCICEIEEKKRVISNNKEWIDKMLQKQYKLQDKHFDNRIEEGKVIVDKAMADPRDGEINLTAFHLHERLGPDGIPLIQMLYIRETKE